MKTLIAILSTTILISCGTEEDTESKEEQRRQDQEAYENYVPPKPTEEPEQVTWYVEIPRCSDRKEEKLVYIPEQDDFIVCRSGKWMYLPMNEEVNEENVEVPVINPNSTEE